MNKKDFNKNFSEVLKNYRKKKGITQIEFSKQSGINLKYIQKLESPKIFIYPRMETLWKVATGMNISLKTLIKKIL